MPAARIALEAYQGEDYVATGTHRVSEGGAVVNITGWTIVLTIKRLPTDSPAVLSVNGVVPTGTDGVYTVSLTAAQTAALGVGDYHCDVWRTNSGAKTELAIGFFSVLQPVRTPA